MGSYTIGLDLGQAQDFTALAVVERVHVTPPGYSTSSYSRRLEAHQAGQPSVLRDGVPRMIEEWHVVYLQRWQIGTPYPVIVDDVIDLMDRDPLNTDGLLMIDGTGVGVAVTDMFMQANRQGRLRGSYPPVRITITGGERANGWNIPKNDLFAEVQVALQQGRLKIPENLPLGDVLANELQSFRQKINTSGRTSVDISRREGQGHGDLVLALCLAMVQPNTLRRPRVIDSTIVPS